MQIELTLPLPPPEYIERMERKQLPEIQDDHPDTFGLVNDVILTF